ncbi:MAG: peroxiredoxin [Thermoplasmataceae archaeon]
MELTVGMEAPDFVSADQMGREVRLSQFKGKPVVLYFYPKDDTPGCTVEACNFRDNNEEFEKKGVKVLGVSVDTPQSHKKFQDKFGLNFTLVADHSKEISQKYNVLSGSTARRVTYIISKDGKVAHIYPKVTPKDHATEVMSKLRELKLIS